MRKIAWILKRVYEVNMYKNPDGTYGADVTYNEGTPPVKFQDISVEWLVQDIERSLVALDEE